MESENLEYIDSLTAVTHDLTSRGYNGEGWYFWDELSASCYGPFVDEADASKAAEEYAKTL